MGQVVDMLESVALTKECRAIPNIELTLDPRRCSGRDCMMWAYGPPKEETYALPDGVDAMSLVAPAGDGWKLIARDNRLLYVRVVGYTGHCGLIG